MKNEENLSMNLENQIELLYQGIANVNDLHKFEKKLKDKKIFFGDKKFVDILEEVQGSIYKGESTELEILYNVDDKNKSSLEKAVKKFNSIITNQRVNHSIGEKLSLLEINRQLTKNSLFLDSAMRDVDTNKYLPQFNSKLIANAYNFLNDFISYPQVEETYKDLLTLGEENLTEEKTVIKSLLENIKNINFGSNYSLFDSFRKNNAMGDSLAFSGTIAFPLMLDSLKKLVYVSANDPTVSIVANENLSLKKNNLFYTRSKYDSRLTDEDVLSKDLENRYTIVKKVSDELFFKSYKGLTELQNDLFNLDKLNRFAGSISNVIQNIQTLDSELEYFRKMGDDFSNNKYMRYRKDTTKELEQIKRGIRENFYIPINEKAEELLKFFEAKRDNIPEFVDKELNILKHDSYINETNKKIKTLNIVKKIYQNVDSELFGEFVPRLNGIKFFSEFLTDKSNVDYLRGIANLKDVIKKYSNNLSINFSGAGEEFDSLVSEKDVRNKYEVVNNLRTNLEELCTKNNDFKNLTINSDQVDFQDKITNEIDDFYKSQKSNVNNFINEYIGKFLNSRYEILFGADYNINQLENEDLVKSGLLSHVGSYDLPNIFDEKKAREKQVKEFRKTYQDISEIKPFLEQIDFKDKKECIESIDKVKKLSQKFIVKNVQESISNLKSYHDYIKINTNSSYLSKKKLTELEDSRNNNKNQKANIINRMIDSTKDISSLWSTEHSNVVSTLNNAEEIETNYNNLMGMIEQFEQTYNKLIKDSQDAVKYHGKVFKFQMDCLDRKLKRKSKNFEPMRESQVFSDLIYSFDQNDLFSAFSTMIMDKQNGSGSHKEVLNKNLPYNRLLKIKDKNNNNGILYTSINTEESTQFDMIKQRRFKESLLFWKDKFSDDKMDKIIGDLSCYLDDRESEKGVVRRSDDFILYYDSNEGSCWYLTNTDNLNLVKIIKDDISYNKTRYKTELVNPQIATKEFGPQINYIKLEANESLLFLGTKKEQDLKAIQKVINPNQNNEGRLKEISAVLDYDSKPVSLFLMERKENEHIQRQEEIMSELNQVTKIINDGSRYLSLKSHLIFSQFDHLSSHFKSLDEKKNNLVAFEEPKYENGKYLQDKEIIFNQISEQKNMFYDTLQKVFTAENINDVELIHQEILNSGNLKAYITEEKTKAYEGLVNFMKSAGAGFSDLSDIILRSDFEKRTKEYKKLFTFYNNLEKISEGKNRIVRDSEKLSYASDLDRVEEYVSNVSFFEEEREMIKNYVSVAINFTREAKKYQEIYEAVDSNDLDNAVSLLVQNNITPQDVMTNLESKFYPVERSYSELVDYIKNKPEYLEQNMNFNKTPLGKIELVMDNRKYAVEDFSKKMILLTGHYNRKQV